MAVSFQRFVTRGLCFSQKSLLLVGWKEQYGHRASSDPTNPPGCGSGFRGVVFRTLFWPITVTFQIRCMHDDRRMRPYRRCWRAFRLYRRVARTTLSGQLVSKPSRLEEQRPQTKGHQMMVTELFVCYSGLRPQT
jgi:hypothetical protein